MPTPRQVGLIRELLDELEWGRRQIRREIGEEFGDWEELDVETASELIDALIYAKRKLPREDRF